MKFANTILSFLMILTVVATGVVTGLSEVRAEGAVSTGVLPGVSGSKQQVKVAAVRKAFVPWTAWQEAQSKIRLFGNISMPGAARGSVMASPQSTGPNYLFHWVRDAALTMSTVVDLYDLAAGPSKANERARYRMTLLDYAHFSRQNQLTATLTGLGEPKFYPDGSAVNDPWCRPQNDGPALRAMTLMRFANRLLDAGVAADLAYVQRDLYDGKIPTLSVIKADLEFVAYNWRMKNCEPWEEVEGHHFYNRMVQRRALSEGAKLARRLNDDGAANFYESQVKQLDIELAKHWNPRVGAFTPTLIQTGGLPGKNSGLDSSTVLAVLHTSYDGSANISFSDPKFVSTVNVLTDAFRSLYSINSAAVGLPGVAIGRYPEDVYGGTHFNYGNPWVLLTAAFSTASYKISAEYAKAGQNAEAAKWATKADSFLDRVRIHANPDGSLSEQIERTTGFMTGARDLTWSHAEVLHAIHARESLLGPQAPSLSTGVKGRVPEVTFSGVPIRPVSLPL